MITKLIFIDKKLGYFNCSTHASRKPFKDSELRGGYLQAGEIVSLRYVMGFVS